jgi:uncharacterized Tic20 family protein
LKQCRGSIPTAERARGAIPASGQAAAAAAAAPDRHREARKCRSPHDGGIRRDGKTASCLTDLPLVYPTLAFRKGANQGEKKMSENPQPQAKEEQNWAMICHLAALSGFVIPLGNILGPLIVWLIKKDTMPLVNQHGKEALNFQITVTIAMVICIVLMFVLIGILLVFVVGIGALVLTIMAAVKVSNGQLDYKYPWTLRLIK